MQGWFRERGDGLDLFIRLTPKSGRDAIEGLAESADGKIHLKVRVRAVPEDGKANKALEALVARFAGIAKSDVRVIAGHASRSKAVHIACAPRQAAEIIRRFESAK